MARLVASNAVSAGLLFASASGLWAAACSFERNGSLPPDTVPSTSVDAAVSSSSGVGPQASSVDVSSSGAGASGGSGGAGGAGGDLGGGGSGGAEPSPCGNGAIDGMEACDDGNTLPGDGCSPTCAVESDAWSCKSKGGNGQSVCTHSQQVSKTPANAVLIVDDGYDGSTDSMTCFDLEYAYALGDAPRTVTDVTLGLTLEHTRVGNLVVKVVSPSPNATTLTVMSRPEYDEADDDGEPDDKPGEDSNASTMYPWAFHDAAMHSAEDLGVPLKQNDLVCDPGVKENPDPCEFHPDPGAGPGKDFGDFLGHSPNGTWKVCVGDAVPGDTGMLHAAVLTIESQPMLSDPTP